MTHGRSRAKKGIADRIKTVSIIKSASKNKTLLFSMAAVAVSVIALAATYL